MQFSSQNRDRIFFAAVFLAAAALRFYNLGSMSLWQDEAFTWARTQQSWLELFSELPSSGNLPLFYFFNKLITDTFSVSPFTLRVFSFLLSLLALPLAILLGKQVGNKPGMYAAAIFWAFHPMLIWYGADAKPYSLTVTLALALLLVFLQLHEGKGSRLTWIGAIALLAAGQLSHYYFFLFAGTLCLIALINIKRDPSFFRKWMTAWGLASLPLIGWLFWYFSKKSPTLGAGWISQPNLTDIVGTLWNLFSGYGGVLSWPTTLLGLATATLIALSLVFRAKQRIVSPVIWFGLITPLFGMWLFSQLRPLYMDRYFIVLQPYVLLLLSSGALALSEQFKSSNYARQLKFGVFLIFAMVAVWAGWQVHSASHYERENWLGLSTYLVARHNPSEQIWLSDNSLRLPLAFYGVDDYNEISSELPPPCTSACWWLLRQPYTATHAFTQAISLPNRDWIPDLPANCQKLDTWTSSTGIALFLVDCPD